MSYSDVPFHICFGRQSPLEFLKMLLSMIDIVLLRYILAKESMRGEARIFLGGRTDQRRGKSRNTMRNALFPMLMVVRSSTGLRDQSAHTLCIHKLLRMPDSHIQLRSRPSNQRRVINDYEVTGPPLYCIESSVQTSMANLATTYMHQGRWEAAEELQIGVIEVSKKKLGADHPDTLTSMRNLAFTLKEQGRDEEAIRLKHEGVMSLTCFLFPNHPHTLSSTETLVGWKAEKLDIDEGIA